MLRRVLLSCVTYAMKAYFVLCGFRIDRPSCFPFHEHSQAVSSAGWLPDNKHGQRGSNHHPMGRLVVDLCRSGGSLTHYFIFFCVFVCVCLFVCVGCNAWCASCVAGHARDRHGSDTGRTAHRCRMRRSSYSLLVTDRQGRIVRSCVCAPVYGEPIDRGCSVFASPHPVTSLQLSADGSLLLLNLAHSTVRSYAYCASPVFVTLASMHTQPLGHLALTCSCNSCRRFMSSI